MLGSDMESILFCQFQFQFHSIPFDQFQFQMFQFQSLFCRFFFTYYFLPWVSTQSTHLEYLLWAVYIPSRIVMEEIGASALQNSVAAVATTSGNMPLVIGLACTQLSRTTEKDRHETGDEENNKQLMLRQLIF